MKVVNIEKNLVVDDHDDFRDILRIFLQLHGFEVLSASNGKEALTKIDQDLKECELFLLTTICRMLAVIIKKLKPIRKA